jgi:amino acid transporter
LAGIQEILTLILLIACIIFLPRLFGGNKASGRKKAKRLSPSGKLRLAIVLSVVFPLVMAVPLPPWYPENRPLFLLGGILPVVLCWAGVWIFQGFRKR